MQIALKNMPASPRQTFIQKVFESTADAASLVDVTVLDVRHVAHEHAWQPTHSAAQAIWYWYWCPTRDDGVITTARSRPGRPRRAQHTTWVAYSFVFTIRRFHDSAHQNVRG